MLPVHGGLHSWIPSYECEGLLRSEKRCCEESRWRCGCLKKEKMQRPAVKGLGLRDEFSS